MFATVASSADVAVELSTIRFGNRVVRISRASHLHEGKLARLARMTLGHDRIRRTVQMRGKVYQPRAGQMFPKH